MVCGDLGLQPAGNLQRELAEPLIGRITRERVAQELEALGQSPRLNVGVSVSQRLCLNPRRGLGALAEDVFDLPDPIAEQPVARPELEERVERVMSAVEIAPLELLQGLVLQPRRVHRHRLRVYAQPTLRTRVLR